MLFCPDMMNSPGARMRLQRKLWSYATARRFDTVNRVEAKGGSIGAIGPTIVGGRVFIGSGYAVLGGCQSGNVLLSFGVD